MKPLILIEMLTVVALGDNSFIPKATATDLSLSLQATYTRMGRLRKFDLFEYKPAFVGAVYKPAIIGFTVSGQRFYNASKYYIETLGEI